MRLWSTTRITRHWSRCRCCPPRSWGECRFVRLAGRPDTADLAVTAVDAWQGRGVGSARLARLSERALEAGIEYFTAEVLAENRTMLAMLPSLGRVETSSHGPVVSARIEIGEPPQVARQELLDLLAAAARAEIVVLPTPLRRLVRVPGELAHVVRLPVTALLGVLGPRLPAQGRSGEDVGDGDGDHSDVDQADENRGSGAGA